MLVMYPLTERSTEDRNRVVFRTSIEGIVVKLGRKRVRHVFPIGIEDLSIMRHVERFDGITDRDKMTLGYLAYLYTLRVADTRMMRRLTTVPREVVTKTKDNVFLSHDIIKYKIATMRCVVQKLRPRQNAKEIEGHFVACGLKRQDALMYHLLCHNGDIHEFIKLMETIPESTFTLDVDTLSHELAIPKIWNEFNKTSNYFSSQKLAFVAHGNRFDFSDLGNDLLVRSIQAYYWVRPFYTVEHAVNYAKRSLQGYTNCLIEYYNSDERARTISDGQGGYTNTIAAYQEEVGYGGLNNQEDTMIEYLDMVKELRAA